VLRCVPLIWEGDLGAMARRQGLREVHEAMRTKGSLRRDRVSLRLEFREFKTQLYDAQAGIRRVARNAVGAGAEALGWRLQGVMSREDMPNISKPTMNLRTVARTEQRAD